MKKRIQLKQMVSFCLVVLIVFAMPLTCLAAWTIEDIENGNYKEVVVGKNIHRSYNGHYLYRFVAPESSVYSISLTNNGEHYMYGVLYDQDLVYIKECSMSTNSSERLDEKLSLKKDDVIYVSVGYRGEATAGYITITSLAPKKPIRTLSKTALSLRAGKQETLYFTGDKSKATWVSRDPAIATVTQNGVVTGKKKGVTFIYSIVNHKLYKTKVSIY